jgi:hypothetical protein
MGLEPGEQDLVPNEPVPEIGQPLKEFAASHMVV